MKLLTKYTKYLPLVIVLVLGLTPLIWFLGKGNVLINGVDTNFPLDPAIWFRRRLFTWNSVSNAGIDFSSSTAGLFFHLIQLIPYKLGFNLQQVQIISLVFWFLLIVFSAFILARIIFPKKGLIQILFVSLYSFNIYLFNAWENVKVANLSLVAAIPLALSILILLKNNKLSWGTAAFYSALTAIVLSGAGINPSYFITFFLILTLYLMATLLSNFRVREVLKSLKQFGFISILIILVNSFWLLPTANFVLQNVSGQRSIDKIGFTNWVDSLSENTSILNVLRLQGAWDWYTLDDVTGAPLYIPYALNFFHRFPFVVFSLAIPTLAFVSFLVRDKKRSHLYLAFALLLVVGVFLGAGTHLPTGHAFRLLLNNLPFFSLFRSPWYIFTPLVSLAYAGLLGLLFFQLDKKAGQLKQKLLKVAVGFSVLILIAGNFLYSYPLVTGKIFRPDRNDSFYIEFPQYVFDFREALGKGGQGRIIGYPDDGLEKFDWGYIGIESILALISDRETLFTPLNAPDSPIAGLIGEFYLSLKRKQIQTARSLASKLNIGYLYEKKDQESIAFPLPEAVGEWESETLGDWNFYKIPERALLPKVTSPDNFILGYPSTEAEKVLSALNIDEHFLNPEDSVVNGIPYILNSSGRVVLAENSQEKAYLEFTYSPSELTNRLTTYDLSKVDFSFGVPQAGFYQPALERYKLENFGIEVTGSLEVELDGKRMSWEIVKTTDSYVYFKPVEFLGGSHKVSFNLANDNLVSGGDFEGEIGFEKGGYGENSASYEIKIDESGKFLSMLNVRKADVTSDFIVSSFDPLSPYYLEFRYKQIYGNNAVVMAGQNTPKTLIKTQIERLPNYPEWNVFSFYYEPVKTDSVMKVFLGAPFTKDPLGTKVLYDDLAVYRVFTNRLLFLKKGKQVSTSPKVTFARISPSMFTAEVSAVAGPHIIVLSENYSPQWELTATSDGKSLLAKPRHFSANHYANAWYLEDTPEKYKIKIYYKPQRLFNLGLAISGLTLVGGFGLFIRERRTKKRG